MEPQAMVVAVVECNMRDYSLIIFCALFLISCGGKSTSNSPILMESPRTGYFVDDPIEGVAFSSQGISGTTGADGSFQYPANSTLTTFSIGNITIGTLKSLPADGVLTPYDVAGVSRSDANNPNAVAIAQFLQSLNDGSTGHIRIPASAIAQLASVPARPLISASGTALSQAELNGLVQVATNNQKTLVPPTIAVASLTSGLQKSYPNLDFTKGIVTTVVQNVVPVIPSTTLPDGLIANTTNTITSIINTIINSVAPAVPAVPAIPALPATPLNPNPTPATTTIVTQIICSIGSFLASPFDTVCTPKKADVVPPPPPPPNSIPPPPGTPVVPTNKYGTGKFGSTTFGN